MARGAKGKPQTGMLRYPTVSATQIAFVYAEDLWIVPKAGGRAEKLTSVPGRVSSPRFSPDGKCIGFTANYAGTWDLWIISAEGGEPRRLTYHPDDDWMVGWLPDGSILFASSRELPFLRPLQLFSLPLGKSQDGKPPGPAGPARCFPLSLAAYGGVWTGNEGGTWWLAFQTATRDFASFKGYRGGLAPEIYLVELKLTKKGKIKRVVSNPRSPVRNLTEARANDAFPMWHPNGEQLLFLSDRLKPEAENRSLGGKQSHLWVKNLKATGDKEAPRRITPDGCDLREPSIGPCDVVWTQDGEIHRLDLAEIDKPKPSIERVRIMVRNLRSAQIPRNRSVDDNLEWYDLSADGKKVVCAARGQIFLFEGANGPTRQLTREPGVANRYPSLSPDGSRVAYWSDAPREGTSYGRDRREYHLVCRRSDGEGEEELLHLFQAKFRYSLFWSPDGEKIAFVDSGFVLQIWYCCSGDLYQVGQLGGELEQDSIEVAFSPCSRWLAYSKKESNRLRALWCSDVEERESYRLTGGYFNDWNPVFAQSGEAIYFLSKRHARKLEGDLGSDPTFANNTSVVRLRLPAGGLDTIRGKATTGACGCLDLHRVLEPNVERFGEPGNVKRLRVGSKFVFCMRAPMTGIGDQKVVLERLDPETRKPFSVFEGVDDYRVSSDGATVLIRAEDRLSLSQVQGAGAIEHSPSNLPIENLRTVVSPKADWVQTFHEVWRLVRDYFRNIEEPGEEWDTLRDRFVVALDQAAVRWDLETILNEMLGELGASHTYFMSQVDSGSTADRSGSMGAELEVSDGAFMVSRIYRENLLEPFLRSPLVEAGLNVGDLITSINGTPASEFECPWHAMSELAGKTVALRVKGKSDEVRLSCLSYRDHRALRYQSWVAARKERVETWGRSAKPRFDLGYVHFKEVSDDGFRYLFQQFRRQVDRDGIVLDLRFNSGGWRWPDRFLRLIDREELGQLDVAGGMPYGFDVLAGVRAKVLLVNDWTLSYGELIAHHFQARGLGPIVGTRTAGSGTGSGSVPSLIGGETLVVANLPFRDLRGEVLIERTGLKPDVIAVDDTLDPDPESDRQLRGAVDALLRTLNEKCGGQNRFTRIL